ncbi:MAG: hypothetical protein IPJ32_18495 [Sphingobacteriaceae bacterium]|nr:hypothetical protein [Sphingobacteriaceae bacterium]
MTEEANGKASEIISSRDSNEKDRRKLKEFFQTDKVSKTTTVNLLCKNKTAKHKTDNNGRRRKQQNK